MITNELTTRVTTDGETYIVPSLGESHTHRVNHQIAIGRDDNNQKLFVANIVKCFVKAAGNVPFQVSGHIFNRFQIRLQNSFNFNQTNNYNLIIGKL